MATMTSSAGNPGDRDSKVAAVCGILLGIFVIATFAASYNFPEGPSQADAILAGFASVRTAFIAGDIFIGLAAVFAIPYLIGMRNVFERKDRVLIASATLLAVVGLAISAVVFIGETAALDVLSASYATGGVSRTAAVIDAQAVIGFGSVVTFGFLVFAAGFAGFGFATIRGKPFPRWLGYVGILGGILFVPGALPVSGAFTVLFVGVVLILVWTFASSAFLWRSGTSNVSR
jgi:hypothetical protein